MAFTTGTATSYADLLDKLRLYAVAQGWTAHAWTAGTVAGGGGFLALEGPGAGAGRRVFVNIRTEANPTDSLYSWRVRGASGYTAGATEGGNPGELQQACYFNLWQNTITYWFYVNDRRIVVVAKCSTAYMSMYAGFFLPWGTPEQYPFPLFISTDYHIPVTWSFTNSGRRMFCDPGGSNGEGSAWARDPGGVWTQIINHERGSSNDDGYLSSSNLGILRCWPYQSGAASNTDYTTWNGSTTTGSGALDNLVATRQGERFLWPVTLIGNAEPAYGVLDGVSCIPGTGLATEQVVTAGAKTFRIFQNIQRSSGNDFFAMEQI